MRINYGFDDSNIAAKERNMTSDADFGVKLHQPIDHHQSFPFSTDTMMVHHANQHRPFDNGPTSSCDGNKSLINYSSDHIYNVGACGATSGGAVGARTLQPFETSETTITTASAFKSPGGNMATSLGFPFTNAQWKELERQAMIYKYMVSSIHAPPHLLIPPPITGNGLDVGFTNRADLEPGRCRRTDGKKWRCSRDVALDQKYCERHMHRGRPRSRKHVELNTSNNNSKSNINKKSRNNPAICTEYPVTVAISNSTINDNNSGSASHDQFVRTTMPQPYIQTPVSVNKSSEKISTFDANRTFGFTYKEPRSSDWMLKGGTVPIVTDDQQWSQLVHTKIGIAIEGSLNDATVLKQHYREESLNLNSFGNFSARENQHSNQNSLFLDESPRGFIDAWSTDANSGNTSCSVSSDAKLPLSHLSLSMGGNRSIDDEMGQIQMGLGLIRQYQNQECGGDTSSTPGGPLAEVLQLRTVNINTGTNQSSSISKNGGSICPPATTASSPSKVLQKTLASLSDSTGNSSPTLATSRTKPEIAMHVLNQASI